MMRLALLAGTAVAGLTPGIAMAAQGSEQGASQESGLTEIIVTAQRREERSQTVPITITAVSSEGLRERSINNVQGLQSQVPSLTIAPNGQANRDVMSPSIRGQGASFQGSPGVVVYLNEVPLPIGFSLSQQGGPGNFVDLQNVQVLSGAQGTLFGRNTTGGAVLLTTARPTDRLEGHLSGAFGNYNMTEFEGVLNLPVTDTLRVRLVGASRDRDGYTQDIHWNKDRDNEHWRMGRIGVEWQPVEAVTNYTMAYYGYSKTNGTGIVPIAFNYPLLQGFSARAATLPAAVGATLNFCPASGANADPNCNAFRQLIADQQQRGIRKVAHGLDDFAKVETWGINNSTDIALADGLKLRNIISYASLKSFYASDQDGTIINLNDTGVTSLSRTAPKDDFHLFTEELQLQGEALDRKLTYTLGGFYSKQSPGGTMHYYGTTVCALPGEAGSLACAGDRIVGVTNESKALFAQATLDFGAFVPALDRLRLTAGYRYTWDRIDGFTIGYNPALYSGTGPDNVRCSFNGVSVARANLANPIDAATPGCRYEGHLRSSAPNWTIGLDYRPINNLMIYGKVSRGYKAGGFNAYAVNLEFTQFGPEYVTDWEAGFKSDFRIAGRPVRLNVNGFNMDYNHIQRGLADFNPTTNQTGAATLSTAKAVIRGVEVETMFKPIDALEIGGNYSHTDAHYKSFSYNAPQPVFDCNSTASNNFARTTTPDLRCIPLQYLAPDIFSVYGRLTLPTPDNIGKVSLFMSYSWTSSRQQAGNQLDKFPGTNVTWEPGSKLPSFGLLSASLDWKKALGTDLDVSVFGTNLLNKAYFMSNSGVYNQVASQSQIFGEPRMYGLRLRYNFGS
ncbi:TonB-dependent receptor [Sphingobium estronivorans]|uniref:TonB-dependent receptor n=1 Tax=Sphingobium estronivorans TaxID=1577690 RepID=UPI001F073B84|nr:TonB-dependent receptor [Sphingobium estronivorans]